MIFSGQLQNRQYPNFPRESFPPKIPRQSATSIHKREAIQRLFRIFWKWNFLWEVPWINKKTSVWSISSLHFIMIINICFRLCNMHALDSFWQTTRLFILLRGRRSTNFCCWYSAMTSWNIRYIFCWNSVLNMDFYVDWNFWRWKNFERFIDLYFNSIKFHAT